MAKVIFQETQKYQNKLVLILLSLLSVAILVKSVLNLFEPQPDVLVSIILVLLVFIIIAFLWWLNQLKLKVAITEKNVKFKLSPLHAKKHSILWKEIEKCEIVTTSEAAQWSGRNITYNHEKRYSLTGRNGLAIKTKKGRFFFIGCKNLSQLELALKALKPKK